MKHKINFAKNTLFGPYLIIVVLGLDIVLSLSRDMVYVGEFMFTVRWFAIDIFILCPLVAGLTATDTARFSNKKYFHFNNQKGKKQYRWILFWSAFLPSVAHLIVPTFFLIVGKFNTSFHVDSWGPSIIALLTQSLVLFWFGVFGLFIGKFLPSSSAGIVSVILSLFLYFKLTAANMSSPQFTVFGDDGASVSQLGLRFRISYLLIRIALLAITGFLLFNSNAILHGKKYLPKITFIIFVLLIGTSFFSAQKFLTKDPILVQKNITYDRELNISGVKIYYFKIHEKYAKPYIDFYKYLFGTLKKKGYSAILPKAIYEGGVGSGNTLWKPGIETTNGNYNDLPTFQVQKEKYGIGNFIHGTIIYPSGCKQMTGDLVVNYNEKKLDEYTNRLTDTILRLINITNDDNYSMYNQKTLKPVKLLTPLQASNYYQQLLKCNF